VQLNSIVGFDLDGTLIDTVPSIALALNLTFQEYGFNEIGHDIVKEKVGMPVEELFRHLDLTSDQTTILKEEFRSNLRTSLSTPSDVYPGVLQLLQNLTKAGCTKAVATSKPTDLAVLTLDAAGILEYFDLIVGTENGKHKPDPWVLEEVQLRLNRDIDVFIGDRLEDALASKNAGIPFIGVLNSVHTRVQFEEHPYLAICDDINALIEYFDLLD
jgi:phosphoglycolate phosphatase